MGKSLWKTTLAQWGQLSDVGSLSDRQTLFVYSILLSDMSSLYGWWII